MAAVQSYNNETLDVFLKLKTLIISNAKLTHGGSKNSMSRTYDIVTSSKNKQYRVSLVSYDEMYKGPGKADVDSKVLARSSVKLNLNNAMEDLLKKVQEELWT